jgi:hypothetical protein
MYSIRAILEKEPAVIAEAIRTILLLLVAFGVVSIGEQNLALVAIAVSVLLQLFVRQASTSKAQPTLAAGTEVSVANSEDKVIIETSPPGPVGVEGG